MSKATAQEFDKLLADVVIPAAVQMGRNAEPLIEWDLSANISEGVALATEWPPSVTGEHGDDNALQLSMRLRDLAISEPHRLAIMRDHLRCDDPHQHGWLERIAHSAEVSGQNQPGASSALADFYGDPAPDLGTADTGTDTRRDRMKGRSFAELKALADPVWILPGMIPDGFTLLYGKPKRGKSFWAIDISVCLAAGEPFHGEPLGRTGKVLYVAAEGGAAAVRNRVAAVLKDRGIDETRIANTWELVDTGIALNDPPSVAKFLKLNSGRYALIVIDTYARNMKGDENSVKDASAFVHGVTRLQETAGAAVIVVHHEGWAAKRIRGSTAMQGAPDAVVRVERDAKTNYTGVTAEDMRDAASGKVMLFTLKDGVLHLISSEMVGAGADKLRERERKMLEILINLHAETDEPVPVRLWRGAVKAVPGILAEGKDTGKSQWTRAVEYMAKAHAIKLTGKGDEKRAVPVAGEVKICDDFDDGPVDDADDPAD